MKGSQKSHTILNKDQLILLTEKTVNWNDSVAGKTTKGIGSLFGWITGQVKKKFQMAKIRGLVMMWGTEYVKALEAFDLNKDVEQAEEEVVTDEVIQEVPDMSKDTSIKELDAFFKDITSNNDFSSLFKNTGFSSVKAAQEYLDSTLDKHPNVHPDVLDGMFKLFTQDSAVASASAKLRKCFDIMLSPADTKKDDGNLIDNETDFYDRLQKIYSKDLPKLEPKNNDNAPEAKKALNEFINGALNVATAAIADAMKKVTPAVEEAPVAKSEETEGEETKNVTGDESEKTVNVQEPVSDDAEKKAAALDDFKKSLKTNLGEPKKESHSINEAAYKLPTRVEELFPKDDLLKFSNVPDIKKKTFPKLNLKSLDSIKYEAEYIINKYKKGGGGKDDSTAAELEHAWTTGYKEVDNYFQKVIDTELVHKSLKGQLSSEEIKKIEEQENSVDMIPKMGLNPLSPSNAKFIDKGLYAFNVDFTSQLGTTTKGIYLVLSPMADMVEDIGGTKFFWHRVFGQYKVDKVGDIQRINVFENKTKNQEMIKNFKNVENTYFVAMENMKVTKSPSKAYFYSNKGSAFFDGKIVQNVHDIIADIKNTYVLDLAKIGNAFNIKVNGRFEIAKDEIKRYPGITGNDLTNEDSFDAAKKNHDLIINNVNKVANKK